MLMIDAMLMLNHLFVLPSPAPNASLSGERAQSRLPPEVNRILYVRNLPFRITAEELYDIFGKYGAVFQIRLGERSKDTRGTAFVGELSYSFSKHLRALMF